MEYNKFLTGQYFFNWRIPKGIDEIVEGEIAVFSYEINGRRLLATNGMGLRRHANGHSCEYIIEYDIDKDGAFELLKLAIGYQRKFNFVATAGESIEGGELISAKYPGKNHLLFIDPDDKLCISNTFNYADKWIIFVNQLALINNNELNILEKDKEYKNFITNDNILKYTKFR